MTRHGKKLISVLFPMPIFKGGIMTDINKVISKVSGLKRHTFKEEQLAAWICELDGRIFTEVMNEQGESPVKDYLTESEKPLLADYPYENIYELYVCSMIDLYSGEIDSYQNSHIVFNEAYNSFASYWLRKHKPPKRCFKTF